MLSTNSIDVLVVDDHPVVRDGVVNQLRVHREIIVVGTAATGKQAIAETARLRPDVVVLDLRLPDCTAPDVIVAMTSNSPETNVLLFTAFPDHISVSSAFAAGAAGLVVKDASVSTLAAAIRDIAHTGHYRTSVPSSSGPSAATGLVSSREYDILRLVATGLTNIEIAEQLSLSPNTIKAYFSSVMRKLDARNRAQVITQARAHGLL